MAADTEEAFVQSAAGLALDLDRIAALRAGLREQTLASPLMDARRFARCIEAAYRSEFRV